MPAAAEVVGFVVQVVVRLYAAQRLDLLLGTAIKQVAGSHCYIRIAAHQVARVFVASRIQEGRSKAQQQVGRVSLPLLSPPACLP